LIGKILAHYEVTGLLGKGGMGEVYRARDTKHDREVALKLLPAEFSQDPERLARFEREARTLASIQHPNIASIYGFEDTGEHRFLVMELAEGSDLAELLGSGPLETTEALKIAQQIARGLEAAHEKGIIHRDLKPSNVMIGSSGQVKLLDFGLARAYESSSEGQDLAHSPTITAAMTQAGVILGTAAYMSPEQARGRPTDRRTDVWSLGAVLFEMLSGEQPFPGEVISDVIARILEREPPWERLAAPSHPLLRRLLERCLAKDPSDRFHDVADVRLEIQGILADPTGSTLGFEQGAAGVKPPAAEPKSRAWRRLLPWAIATVLAVALVASFLLRPTPAPQLVEFAITAPPSQHLREFSLAPDGSSLVFVAIDRGGTSKLWLRRLHSAQLVELNSTEGAMFPFWSPDSRAVAFFAGGKLKRLDLASESVQSLADAPNGRGGAWHEEGTILFTPDGQDVLYSVSSLGGSPMPVTELAEGEASHRFPHFLPDSRRFVFCAHGPNSDPTHRYIGSLDSPELIRLPDGMSEVYTPPGHLLYLRERTLVAHAFDSGSMSLRGAPLPLFNTLLDTYPRTGRSSFSVSNAGALAYLQSTEVDSRFQWVDRNGRRGETMGPHDRYLGPSISHGGRHLVFLKTAASGPGSLWLLDIARESTTRLVEFDRNASLGLAWSPDDRSVLYTVDGAVFRMNLRGGAPEVLLDTTSPGSAASFQAPRSVDMAADKSFIVFDGWDAASDYDLWMLQLVEDAIPQRLSQIRRVQGSPKISPDMRWIAYESDESGRFEIYLRAARASEQKWLVSTGGGSAPIWNEDGTELYFLSPENVLMAVSIGNEDASPEVGLPVALFEAPEGPPNNDQNVSTAPSLVAAAGDRFLFHVPAEELPTRAIKVVLNWELLLER
jgi:Tol biopolymer transport system component